MAEEHIIHCQDCGNPYSTKRDNTKFCAVCRLYRDLIYMGTRSKHCLECEQVFAPLKTSDLLCGKCDFIGSSQYGIGECSFCHTPQATLVRKDVAVCLGCARDPEQRKLLIKALHHKIRTRSEAVV